MEQEPGTKEVLSLDELEAAVGLRTGRKHILSILVENVAGCPDPGDPRACSHGVGSTSTRSRSDRPMTRRCHGSR